MADSNSPFPSRTNRAPAQTAQGAESQDFDQSGYIEDPLIELARIVSEATNDKPASGSGKADLQSFYGEEAKAVSRNAAPQPTAPEPAAPIPFQQPHAVQQPQAVEPQPAVSAQAAGGQPDRGFEPLDLAGNLEAELMAELRPAYEDAPRANVAEPVAVEPVAVEPVAVEPAAVRAPVAEPAAPQPQTFPAAPVEAPAETDYRSDLDLALEEALAPLTAAIDEVEHAEASPYISAADASEPAPQGGGAHVPEYEPVAPPQPSVAPAVHAAGHAFSRDTAFREPRPAVEPSIHPGIPPIQDEDQPTYAQAVDLDALHQQQAASAEDDYIADPFALPVPQAGAVEGPADEYDDMPWPAAEAALAASAHGHSHSEEAYGDLDDELFEPETAYAPGVAADHVLPPHSDAEKAAAPARRSSRRGLVIAAAVAAIVIFGAAGFVLSGMFGDGSPTGPAQVITADAAPFKVYPEAKDTEASIPSKAIYDRVGGVEAPRNEQLVSREEAPVDTVPTTGNSRPRVATANEDVQDGEVSPTSGLPRRVRTVVVRPDGSIITAPQEPETAAPSDQPQQLASVDPVTETTPAPGDDPVTRTVTTEPVTAAPANSDRVAISTTDPEETASATATDAPETNVTPVEIVPRPKPSASEIAALSPAQTGVQSGGPLDLGASQPAGQTPVQPTAPAAPAAQPAPQQAAATPAIPADAYIVQISSQRSREQAASSYANVQRRFASVLGGIEPVIQTADLGERGVYYRAGVLADDRDGANRLCGQLKAAGGDCFVRRAN